MTDIKIIDYISDSLHDIKKWFIVQYEALSRQFFWAKKMRWNYDWDGVYIYKLLNIKLERMIKIFRDHGHTVWTSENTKLMKQLLEANELSKRLFEYDNIYFYKFIRTYAYKKHSINVFSQRLKYKTEKTMISKEKYIYLGKIARKKDATSHKLLKDRFFYLLNKNIENWWD